jgi:prepilin peptidase CpaA
MPQTSFVRVLQACFVVLLLVAVVTDVRSRRVPNVVVGALALLGTVSAAATPGRFVALAMSVGAMTLGLVMWFPFYAFRMLGAGDVKLFAAASAWLTPWATVRAALAAALLGGVFGVLWLIRTHGVALASVRLFHASHQPSILREPLPADSRDARLPYAVPMVAALLYQAWLLHGVPHWR